MGSFWSNFTNAPGGRRRRGLGRWFQILEDRFMTLFWANLMCMACSLIFLVSLFFFSQTGHKANRFPPPRIPERPIPAYRAYRGFSRAG